MIAHAAGSAVLMQQVVFSLDGASDVWGNSVASGIFRLLVLSPPGS